MNPPNVCVRCASLRIHVVLWSLIPSREIAELVELRVCVLCGVCVVTAELALDAIHDAFHGNSRVG